MKLSSKNRIQFVIALLLLSASAAHGQSAAPSGAQSGTGGNSLGANATRIETEVVTLTSLAASPSQIQRRPGPFFLVLKPRRGTALPALAFGSPGFSTAQLGTLTQDFNAALFQQLNHGAMLLNLPAGELDLKSQATGKVLLKITIQ